MPLRHRLPLALAALLALPLAAQAQRSSLIEMTVPERPAEIRNLTVQQYGGACEILFKREVKNLSAMYFQATDGARASVAHELLRELMARKYALNTFRATGLGIAPADVPVIQKAFQAPNMTPAGMERTRKFCDQYGDAVEALVRQHADTEQWVGYQAEISVATLKALMESAPKEDAER
ncbi:hypothetical protein [uncultured Hydrogenophaga sp.]|uniref:hypothetical protein n=1 Tax=uncultured Hydrogenophaga sp. TaxID=199683 RepID=UPI00258E7B8E|nr:hypothetical protein [uncultured Hydrogenophaga sp.]